MDSETRKRWDAGFIAGVLSALAVINSADSVLYREIVQACGAKELLREAIEQGDAELPRIREAVADLRSRRRRHRAAQ